MSTDVSLKIDGLAKITKMLKGQLPNIRIGVLGKDARSGGGSNATVGAAHEYGTSKMPARSFLRMPLTEYLNKYLEKSGVFSEHHLKQLLKEGNLIPLFKTIAVQAEAVVAEAFDTGGFGKWAKWKNPNYKNNTGQVLVDTQQLRNSITSEVK